ncbi:Iterative polyketide synthase CazM 5 [Colletotrichum chlorophyti]|uniref:Iterative polyketide synthase CazM 5 n=1 Tax=Colletotrichum chlorophyti TaxID=708187 RepID=A0A1Q8S2A4_9PEZI|nr:Iterative polyketide synthase CazM 5 [Colletotrichum chlorophyti]
MTEAAELGAIAVRLALCTAAFVDLDQLESAEPVVCISARYPRSMSDGREGTGEGGPELFKETMENYQQAYTSVRIDATSATITATRGVAKSLMRDLEDHGVMVKEIDLKGRFHYPGHADALRKLVQLCTCTPMLQFPEHKRPLIPLRQNINGAVVSDEIPLHETVLRSILTDTADWHTTMAMVMAATVDSQGADTGEAGSPARLLVQLGPVDCVPRSVLTATTFRVLQSTTNETMHYGYPDDAIAVIGLSCRFPDAETPKQFWDVIRGGKKTSNSFPDVGSFDCGLFRKSPREAEYMDPQHRLGLHLAYEALESGGYFSPSSSSTDNVGCYVGMSSCDYEDHVNARPPTAFSFTGTARAFASGRISHFFGLTGPSMVIDTACSSSGVAIHTACKAIQSGECAMALAGGINLMTPEGQAHQNLAGASFLSPTGQCRPFDIGADGYRRGQGGGFVLLKRLSAAVADNDRILGVLTASAVNNSKGSRSITLPSSESQSSLYQQVLRSANLHPRYVSYVEAHGTGTQKGDPVECQSIRNVFGGDRRAGCSPIRFGSVKANIGHGEAASGIASLIKVLLMLQHGLITPQANFSALNPAIPPLDEANMEIAVEIARWKGPCRTALINNYGASGVNAAMVVRQPPSTRTHQALSAAATPRRFPFLVTASTAVALQRNCRALLHFIKTQVGSLDDDNLPSFAFHLAQRQNHTLTHRVVFSAASVADLHTQLLAQVEGKNAVGGADARNPTVGPKPVVLLFSGQTGRRAHVNRDAYLSLPLLRRHLDRCDRILQSLGLHSLFPRMFDAEPVGDLVDLHCMQFALQYSVAASWIDAGLEVKALVGHSLVTHAFHSRLVDDILPDYYRLLRGLVFHPATIPIEPCSEPGGGWDSVTPELVGRQSREPVYFAQAVSRVEERLGSCIWLEAGSGSAAITMTRRALEGQQSHGVPAHSFDAVQLHGSDPISSLADTTLGLWNKGVRVQFWLYHASQRQSFVPMDLPSYQFEKTQHWLPFIERHKGPERESQGQPQSLQEPLDLVSLIGNADATDAKAFEFSINQNSDEYSLFVRGRTVFGHILAPGSVYAESAARAFTLLPTHTTSADQSLAPVELSQLKLHAPFGIDLQRRLRLILRRLTASCWDFVVESRPLHNDPSKPAKLQASGSIRLQGPDNSHFGASQRLLRRLHDRCDELRDDPSASVVQGAYVKRIMGRVASYDDRYFGIRFIASRGLEAVGDVELLPIESECRAGIALSPPVFDNFLLVAELHAGSLGDLAEDHLYICGGFDAIIPHISSSEDSSSQPEGPWTVLSTLERDNEKTVTSDILVFDARKKTLFLSILGAKLTQIPKRSLQKVLEEINVSGPAKIKDDLDTTDKMLQVDSWGATPQSSFASTPTINTKAGLGIADYLHPDFSNRQIHHELHSVLSPAHDSTTSSQLTSTDHTKESLGFVAEPSVTPASSAPSEHDQSSAVLYNLLAEHLDCSNGIPPDMPLGNIGLDSLVAIQIQSDLERLFGKSPSLKSIDERTTFLDLCSMVLQPDLTSQLESKSFAVNSTTTKSTSNTLQGMDHSFADAVPVVAQTPVLSQGPSAYLTLAVGEFDRVKKETGVFAQQTEFAGFYAGVHQKQASLVVAYILEAFSALGCDLRSLGAGEPVPTISYLPKHQKLVSRLCEILEEAEIISASDSQLFRYRTDAPLPPSTPSADLYRDVLTEYPRYQPDHQLLNVTASRLADCLSGRADPLQLLFQDRKSLALLEDVYVSSPMFSMGNNMLGEMLRGLLSHSMFQRNSAEKLRILEIGAGTGATTRRVLDQLLACDVDFTYTFTDISLALVNSSKKKFSDRYGRQRVQSDMEFMVLDIEKPVPVNMLQSYHLVISSNCIHATKDLRQSCANIEKLVRRGNGILCLLELTRPLGWLDCVFGLLDGWWRFEDGRIHALAHESDWKARLQNAGFRNVDWTDDGSRESQHFRLITAWH